MRVKGQETVAAMFGVAPKTIVEWQEQGLPVAERGGPGVPSQYESADCIRWLVEREVRKVQGESPNDRLARVKADEIEMNLAERRGLLIRADAIEPQLRAAVVSAREGLLAEAPEIARAGEGRAAAELEPLLVQAFERLLVRLANWRAAAAEEEGADLPDEEEDD